MRTYIKSSEFQSRSEFLVIENCLPLTEEVTVDLVLMLATFTPLGIALRNTRVNRNCGFPNTGGHRLV